MDQDQGMDNPVYGLHVYFIGRQVFLPGTLELKLFTLLSFPSQLLHRLS